MASITPKQVKVRLIDNFTRHLIRSNDLLGTPINIKFQYTQPRSSALVSSNHLLDTKFKNLLGTIWVRPSATHDGLPLRDHLAEFTINSRTSSSNEEFSGKLLSMLCIQSHNQRPFQNERLPCHANYGNTVVDAEHLDSIAHSGFLRSRSGSEWSGIGWKG
jgi:hypothetical protein